MLRIEPAGLHDLSGSLADARKLRVPFVYLHAARDVWVNQREVEQVVAANPLGRVGTADDVAKLAVFLASDDAWYINAAAIPVDGGQSVIE